ncbi:rhomboid family intramembrane serine protease [Rubritalea tangerina]|uniref:Rhomboid family intramembrane serine protease n=1 Tax=Rubritalea tangerina TaxID=430798 RepID=A0ABW4Z9X3_9BACT
MAYQGGNHWKEQGVLLGLIGFMGVVFLGQEVFGPSWYWRFMMVPAEFVDAWENALVGDVDWASFIPVMSCALLHGGIDHWMFNMLFLWIFGGLAMKLLGSKWMIMSFLFTAVCGTLLHVVLNSESEVPMLGASGAVLGFEGLYLAMAVRWRLPDPDIWPMSHPISPAQLAAVGIMGLVTDYMGFLGGTMGVAYSAHLGGFLGGLFLGGCVVPMPGVARER